MLDKVQAGDMISRDAEEGFRLYEKLFHRDISLVFLKEPHINTETYKRAVKNQINMTGDKIDLILEELINI